MQQLLFLRKKMKKLSTELVKKIFSDSGCELLGEYVKCNEPLDYVCSCGTRGFITLEKFRSRINRGGGCKRCNRHQWSDDEDNYLRDNYGKIPRKDIMEKIPGISYNDLKNRAYLLGLTGNRSEVQKKCRLRFRQYDLDLSYFDEIAKDCSYWAGFVATYGNLNKSRNSLSLRLDSIYEDHLRLFCSNVGYTGKLHEIDGNYVLLQFHGVSNWLEKLEKNYLITEKKYNNLMPPIDLDEINSLSYIIGYIDGYGKLSVDDEYIWISGTHDVLCWIKTWFDKISPSIQRRYAVVRPYKNGSFIYKISGGRALYILRRLNEIEVPKMVFKWKKVSND